MLILMRLEGKLVASMVVDMLGPDGIAGKNFWYDPEVFFSPVQVMFHINMQFGWKLQKPYLYVSYFDPQNPLLAYKAVLFQHIMEILDPVTGQWVPLYQEGVHDK